MKTLIIVLICINLLDASSNNYELELYETILPNIFQKKVLAYSDKKTAKILKGSKVITLTKNCHLSDVLVGKSFNHLPINCQSKPIFSTSHRSFKYINNSIGAFYWRKGRPQIKFRVDNIKKFNLYLSKGLMEFAE